MLTYPWKCTVLHCNHLGNTWKPLVLMTRHFDYCPSASEGDNQSVRSSAPVVSRCFPGGYNVKLYISRGRLAWWLLAFLHSERWWILTQSNTISSKQQSFSNFIPAIMCAPSIRHCFHRTRILIQEPQSVQESKSVPVQWDWLTDWLIDWFDW